jgi:hypothetical protein
MNENQLDNPYYNTQDHISDGIVQKIKSHYKGVRLSILLNEIVSENDINLDPLHPETVRALCHYASVLAGEATNTAILFEPGTRQQWVDNGYKSMEVSIENEFIVVPRQSREVKKKPTHEPLSKYDLDRRKSKDLASKLPTNDDSTVPVNLERPRRQQRRIPRHISNMTNRRDRF